MSGPDRLFKTPFQPKTHLLLVVLALAVLAMTGCSGLRQGTEKVVGLGLEAANLEENRALVEKLLTSAEVREATRELTGVVLETAVEDLTSQQRSERLREAAVRLVDDLVPALSQSFGDEVWPGVRDNLEEAVGVVLQQVLSDEIQLQAKKFATDTAREVIEATAPELAEAVSKGLGDGLEKALVAVVQGQVLPLIEDLTREDPGPKVAELARQTTHGALLGVADAMNGEFGEVFRQERRDIIDQLKEPTEPFNRVLAVLAALLVVGLIAIVLMYRAKRRRDDALTLLVAAIHRQGIQSDELVRDLNKTGGSGGAAYLRDLLSK